MAVPQVRGAVAMHILNILVCIQNSGQPPHEGKRCLMMEDIKRNLSSSSSHLSRINSSLLAIVFASSPPSDDDVQQKTNKRKKQPSTI